MCFDRRVLPRRSNLIVPGTSLKGAFRHLFEAITHSCYAQYNRFPNQGGQDVEDEFKSCTYRGDKRQTRDPKNHLCPACRVFGALGYLGQIAFQPARLIGEQHSEIVFAPQHWTPKVSFDHRHTRKLYTHQPMIEEPAEPVEVLPPGSRLSLEAHFRNLSDVELGLLLMILGQDANQIVYPKLGGLKAHGFGAVEITLSDLGLIVGNYAIMTRAKRRWARNIAKYVGAGG
jgi:CRISPR/Cas system CSM-associated protein Csm3 (group 7 of RAMP superfamily)